MRGGVQELRPLQKHSRRMAFSRELADSSGHNKSFIFVPDNIFALGTICPAGRDLEKKTMDTLLHTEHEVGMPHLASRCRVIFKE